MKSLNSKKIFVCGINYFSDLIPQIEFVQLCLRDSRFFKFVQNSTLFKVQKLSMTLQIKHLNRKSSVLNIII